MCVAVVVVRVGPANSTLDPSLVVVPRRGDPPAVEGENEGGNVCR